MNGYRNKGRWVERKIIIQEVDGMIAMQNAEEESR
jgi:hypothetical protein